MLTGIAVELYIFLSRPLTSQFYDVVFDFFFQAEFLLTSKERLHLKRALQQYELNRYGLISALRLFIYFLVVRPFAYLRSASFWFWFRFFSVKDCYHFERQNSSSHSTLTAFKNPSLLRGKGGGGGGMSVELFPFNVNVLLFFPSFFMESSSFHVNHMRWWSFHI